MKRIWLLVAVAVAVLAATSCEVPYPGPDALYIAPTSNLTNPTVTARSQPIVWGSAPPIDANYGGTIYAGTGLQQQDPRPALVGGREPLRAWVASPGTGLPNQPAIVWVHGGGFAVGIESMYGLANTTGREFAERGYVSISVEYRIDTTLVGSGARPPSLCQWVQDNQAPTDPTWVARRDQCARNILTAQYDIQGFVRWLRLHAADYGVDPEKISVGGFSAGAVTALNLGYRSHDIGTETYFSGDPRSTEQSRVAAVLAASGCAYGADVGPSPDIDASDAPVSIIASKFDAALPYSCVKQTVQAARSKGLTAELFSYCTEGLHANDLRDAHKDETDSRWVQFLGRKVPLYSEMPDPGPDQPFCT